ncbi:protein MEI2-like 1 [Ziziphus jujuba]|uniref:Protein MEI2-like 1 n=1 Tax=Ziziphus jujuba TaxID=326968 RepID=A0A6P6GF17_ZIZJJ|nr:protein MEI2-like 1 [Ziziphus jujuba]
MAESEVAKLLNPEAQEFFPQKSTHLSHPPPPPPPPPYPHLHFPPPPPAVSNPFFYYTTTTTSTAQSPPFHTTFYYTTSTSTASYGFQTEPSISLLSPPQAEADHHLIRNQKLLNGPKWDKNGGPVCNNMSRCLSGRRVGRDQEVPRGTHQINRRIREQLRHNKLLMRREVDDGHIHHTRSSWKYNNNENDNRRNNKVETSTNWSVAIKKKKNKSEVLPMIRGGNYTTLMIRNIPSKYTRQMVLDFLDHHCMMENRKVAAAQKLDDAAEEDDHHHQNLSAFDFLYLPMDFKSGLNKGYAFVNFTKAEAAWKFYDTKNNQTWDHFQSSKIREIARARLQGKVELVKHFEKMGFPCESEEVLPVCYCPARDGSNKWVKQRTVGRRLVCIGSSSVELLDNKQAQPKAAGEETTKLAAGYSSSMMT